MEDARITTQTRKPLANLLEVLVVTRFEEFHIRELLTTDPRAVRVNTALGALGGSVALFEPLISGLPTLRRAAQPSELTRFLSSSEAALGALAGSENAEVVAEISAMQSWVIARYPEVAVSA